MKLGIHNINATVDILVCISIKNIKTETEEHAELQMFKRYIIGGWSHVREVVEPEVQEYWPISH